jgi:tripartite-type tricarboxylate transporter receptor subunit TctC
LRLLKSIGCHAMAAALGMSFAASAAFAADTYPSRPVRFIVPGASGSATDRTARLVADKLTGLWNSPVVVEDKPGASGMIAAEYVAHSPPDGYTALFPFVAFVQAPALFPSVSYDFRKDFAPVTAAVVLPSVLAVPGNSPYHTLAEFIAAAKAKPDTISYGSFGLGTSFHIYGETLAHDAGIKLIHVPFKSEALSLNDLVGGHLDSAFQSVAISSELIKAGRLRPLAIIGTQRSAILPDVPTFSELGFKRLDARGWFGLVLPAATPRPIVEKMSADVNAILKRSDVIETIHGMSAEPAGMTPEQFAAFLNSEYEKWHQLIKDVGITAAQ